MLGKRAVVQGIWATRRSLRPHVPEEPNVFKKYGVVILIGMLFCAACLGIYMAVVVNENVERTPGASKQLTVQLEASTISTAPSDVVVTTTDILTDTAQPYIAATDTLKTGSEGAVPPTEISNLPFEAAPETKTVLDSVAQLDVHDLPLSNLNQINTESYQAAEALARSKEANLGDNQVASVPSPDQASNEDLNTLHDECPVLQADELSLEAPQRYSLNLFQLIQTSNADPTQRASAFRYSFLIEPLPVFGCSEKCVSGPVCSKFTFFEILVSSANVKANGRLSPLLNGSWAGEVWLPTIPGIYTIDARLIFNNYASIYEDYKSGDDFFSLLASNLTYRARFPKKIWSTPIVNSPQFVTIPGTSNEINNLRKGLPLCIELSAWDASLFGWWDPSFSNFFPFACRLLSIRPDAVEGKEGKEVIYERIANKWIALYGDGEMRHLFFDLCRQLGIQKFAKPQIDSFGKDDNYHACFSFPGEGRPPVLITSTTWWGTMHFRVIDQLKASAKELLGKANSKLPPNEAINIAQYNSTSPDMMIISMGSNEYHRLSKRGETLFRHLMKAQPQYVASKDRCRHLAIALLPPTSPSTASKYSYLSFLLHNVPRTDRLNVDVRNSFKGCRIIDFFSSGHLPYLNGHSIRTKKSLSLVQIDMMLSYIVLGRNLG